LGRERGHRLTRVVSEAASDSASGNAHRSAAGSPGSSSSGSCSGSPVSPRDHRHHRTRQRCRETSTALSKFRTTPQPPAIGDFREASACAPKPAFSARTFRTPPPATTPGFSDAAPEAAPEHKRVSDPSKKVCGPTPFLSPLPSSTRSRSPADVVEPGDEAPVQEGCCRRRTELQGHQRECPPRARWRPGTAHAEWPDEGSRRYRKQAHDQGH